MNIQNLFAAVREHSGEHALVVVARELERQGYKVKAAGHFDGSQSLISADEAGELERLPVGIGVEMNVEKGGEIQSFRLHFLDLDAVCLTDLNSPPVIHDPKFTIDEFRSGDVA